MKWGRTTLIHNKCPTDVQITIKPSQAYLPSSIWLPCCLMTVFMNISLLIFVLRFKQKVCRRQACGSKDHLLLDKSILGDFKKKKKRDSYMWIYYNKAYNLVPHSWISIILEIYKINDTTWSIINYLMPLWCTRIYLPYAKRCMTT